MKGFSVSRPYSNGQVRLRVRSADGSWRHAGMFDDAEAAERMAVALFSVVSDTRRDTVVDAPLTLRSWGSPWLDRRELVQKLANVDTDRGRWRLHVLAYSIADVPLPDLEPKHVRAWLDSLRRVRSSKSAHRGGGLLSSHTVKHALNLVRRALQDAVEAGHIAANPAAGIRLARQRATHDPWTYLVPVEQARLTSDPRIPEAHRLMVAIAIAIGWRLGEFSNQEIRDVQIDGDEPRIVIRYGGPGRAPTKGGRPRVVPLSGVVLAAVERWLEILPSYAPKNPHGLLFPTPRGARLFPKKAPRWWAEARRLAGLDEPAKRHDGRPVRWHDLRHTCASSLVAGWWGRRWSLEEVCKLLGHSSITVTQRYAHLADSALRDAMRGTGGLGGSGAGQTHDKSSQGVEITDQARDLLSRGSGVRVPSGVPSEIVSNFATDSAKACQAFVTPADVITAIAAGSPDAYEVACAYAKSVLELEDVRLALAVLDGDQHWARKALALAGRGLEEASYAGARRAGGAS